MLSLAIQTKTQIAGPLRYRSIRPRAATKKTAVATLKNVALLSGWLAARFCGSTSLNALCALAPICRPSPLCFTLPSSRLAPPSCTRTHPCVAALCVVGPGRGQHPKPRGPWGDSGAHLGPKSGPVGCPVNKMGCQTLCLRGGDLPSPRHPEPLGLLVVWGLLTFFCSLLFLLQECPVLNAFP